VIVLFVFLGRCLLNSLEGHIGIISSLLSVPTINVNATNAEGNPFSSPEFIVWLIVAHKVGLLFVLPLRMATKMLLDSY